tara:strand:+ start:1488 stop:1940 length:453 start_codon:yes stop_codon:yes gene_type:complete
MIRDLTKEEGIDILDNNYIGHMAYVVGTSPFIVPITYYHDNASNSIISYSSEGHKIEAMRNNDLVTIEVDEISSVVDWQTVMVHGTFEELHGIDAKHMLHAFAQGVKNIILRKEGKEKHFISEFSSKLYSEGTPIVYRINIIEMIGKARN